MTTSTTSATRVAPVTVAGIRRALDAVLPEVRAGAVDREHTRTLPYDAVRAVAATGVLLLRIPAHLGGAGGTVRDVVDAVVRTARADSNVAQALRPSVLVADGLAASAEPDRRTLDRLLRGDLFSGTRNEASGTAGAVGTRVTRTATGHEVNGEKYYSTGGLFADWFSGNAVTEDGTVVTFTVPTSRAGVSTVDDFDAIGQRLTASGTTRLDHVALAADEFRVEHAGRHLPHNPLAQLHLAAVAAGITAAALDDAVAFVRDHARPIKHSTATRSVDDPYVRHVVGEVSAAARTARAVVLDAADGLEALLSPATLPPAVDVVREATIGVAEAQYAAVQQALRAGELLLDVGSGSATRREHALDRHWRNARTVANHNPRDWKAAVIGGWRLVGDPPPDSGLF